MSEKEEKELTYGEIIKQPFPELEDIATDEEGLLEIEAYFLSVIIERYIENLTKSEQYEIYKSAYDNGVIVEWKLKQTDPHAEIKAEYDKAIADGKIVKVFWKMPIEGFNAFMEVPKSEHITKNPDIEYELRYYNIDWNKLLSWSYANSEFVECEFSDDGEGKNKAKLIGMDEDCMYYDNLGYSWAFCHLAKGVEIKDEWLKEVK